MESSRVNSDGERDGYAETPILTPTPAAYQRGASQSQLKPESQRAVKNATLFRFGTGVDLKTLESSFGRLYLVDSTVRRHQQNPLHDNLWTNRSSALSSLQQYQGINGGRDVAGVGGSRHWDKNNGFGSLRKRWNNNNGGFLNSHEPPLSLKNARMGLIALLARDWNSSSVLEKKIEADSKETIDVFFNNFIFHILELMVDSGAYRVLIKLMEKCSSDQMTQIVDVITRQQFQFVSIRIHDVGSGSIQSLVKRLQNALYQNSPEDLDSMNQRGQKKQTAKHEKEMRNEIRKKDGGVPVFVMTPLDSATLGNTVNRRKAMKASLQAWKSAGVEGIMIDVWCGLVEKESPGAYNWGGYNELLEMAEKVELKDQAVMSSHQCIGKVGDSVTIPLPQWVVEEIDKDPDLAYTVQWGRRNDEFISLGVDTLPLSGLINSFSIQPQREEPKAGGTLRRHNSDADIKSSPMSSSNPPKLRRNSKRTSKPNCIRRMRWSYNMTKGGFVFNNMKVFELRWRMFGNLEQNPATLAIQMANEGVKDTTPVENGSGLSTGENRANRFRISVKLTKEEKCTSRTERLSTVAAVKDSGEKKAAAKKKHGTCSYGEYGWTTKMGIKRPINWFYWSRFIWPTLDPSVNNFLKPKLDTCSCSFVRDSLLVEIEIKCGGCSGGNKTTEISWSFGCHSGGSSARSNGGATIGQLKSSSWADGRSWSAATANLTLPLGNEALDGGDSASGEIRISESFAGAAETLELGSGFDRYSREDRRQVEEEREEWISRINGLELYEYGAQQNQLAH